MAISSLGELHDARDPQSRRSLVESVKIHVTLHIENRANLAPIDNGNMPREFQEMLTARSV
jgi:hypothetical protein